MTTRDEAMARRTAAVAEAFHLEGRGGGAAGGVSGIPHKFDTRLHPHGRGGKFAQTFTVKLKKHSETKIAGGNVDKAATARVDAVHVNGQHVGFVHHTVEKAASQGYSNKHAYYYQHGAGTPAREATSGVKLPIGGSKLTQAAVEAGVKSHIEANHPELGMKSGEQLQAEAAAEKATTRKLTGELKPGDVVELSKGVHRTIKSLTPKGNGTRVAYQEPADEKWGAANQAGPNSAWNVVPHAKLASSNLGAKVTPQVPAPGQSIVDFHKQANTPTIPGVTTPSVGADKATGMPDPAKPDYSALSYEKLAQEVSYNRTDLKLMSQQRSAAYKKGGNAAKENDRLTKMHEGRRDALRSELVKRHADLGVKVTPGNEVTVGGTKIGDVKPYHNTYNLATYIVSKGFHAHDLEGKKIASPDTKGEAVSALVAQHLKRNPALAAPASKQQQKANAAAGPITALSFGNGPDPIKNAGKEKPLGEQQIPGATAIVGGKAGRWVKLNGVQSHIPHHEDYSREVGGDTFTSPKGTTAVLKNGVMFSAPRGQKGDVSLVAKTATTAPSAPSLHGGPVAKEEPRFYVHDRQQGQASGLTNFSAVNPRYLVMDRKTGKTIDQATTKHVAAGSAADENKKAKAPPVEPKEYTEQQRQLDIQARNNARRAKAAPMATTADALKPQPAAGNSAAGEWKFAGQGIQNFVRDGKVVGTAGQRSSNGLQVRAQHHATGASTWHRDLASAKKAIEDAAPAKPVTPQIPNDHPLTVALHGELSKSGITKAQADVKAQGTAGFEAATGLKPEHAQSGARSSAGRLRNFGSMSDEKLHQAHAQVVGYNASKGIAGDHEGEQAVVTEMQKRGISASLGSQWTFQEPASSHSTVAGGEHTIAHYADGSSKLLSAQGKAASLASTNGETLRPELNSPGRSSAGRLRNFQAMSDAKLTGVLTQLTHHNHPVHGQDHEALAAAQAEAIKRTMGHHMQEASFTTEQRKKLAKKGYALPDGSFPIRNGADLADAIHSIGRASDPAKAKAHIVKRAKALKAQSQLPDGWLQEASEDELAEAELIADAAECLREAADSLVKASTPQPFSTSKTSNWIARLGGLPDYIQHVAHGLVRSGKTESEAIQMAIGIMTRWARGGGNVDKNTQAAAAKALSQWEALKAKQKAKRAASAA